MATTRGTISHNYLQTDFYNFPAGSWHFFDDYETEEE